MKKILLILFLLTIGCGSYNISSHRIKSVLALSETGDTIAVPISQFSKFQYENYLPSYNNIPWNSGYYYNNFGWNRSYQWMWQPNGFWNNYGFNSYNWNNYNPAPRLRVKPRRRIVQNPNNTQIPHRNLEPRLNNPTTPRVRSNTRRGTIISNNNTPRRVTPNNSNNNTPRRVTPPTNNTPRKVTPPTNNNTTRIITPPSTTNRTTTSRRRKQ